MILSLVPKLLKILLKTSRHSVSDAVKVTFSCVKVFYALNKHDLAPISIYTDSFSQIFLVVKKGGSFVDIVISPDRFVLSVRGDDDGDAKLVIADEPTGEEIGRAVRAALALI